MRASFGHLIGGLGPEYVCDTGFSLSLSSSQACRSVIASGAKQSSFEGLELFRRLVPRNDDPSA
jgi:hypothetical protein